jgi:hypothetical protein
VENKTHTMQNRGKHIAYMKNRETILEHKLPSLD